MFIGYGMQAIENVTPEQQSIFVKELTDNVLQCVKDANGNHVSMHNSPICYHSNLACFYKGNSTVD